MAKSKVIRDPVHGTIEITADELRIVDTAEFRMLDCVHQLGVAHRVFPGATHTRWLHSLGTAHVVGLFLEILHKNQPELKLDARTIALVRCGSLMHDAGHCLYSHLFDEHVAKHIGVPQHEDRSCLLFRHLVLKYKLEYTGQEVDFICNLIRGTAPAYQSLYPRYLFDLVHNTRSDFDLERFDYLPRDSLYALGVKLDLQMERIFRNARVISDSICYHEKVAPLIKELLEHRCRLHWTVYKHPVVVGIDYLVGEILRLLADVFDWADLFKSPSHEWRWLTDSVLDQMPALRPMLSTLTDPGKKAKLEKAFLLFDRLQSRRLYKFLEARSPEEHQQKQHSDSKVLAIPAEIGVTSSNLNPFERLVMYDDNGQLKPLKDCRVSKVSVSVPKESVVFVFNTSDS